MLAGERGIGRTRIPPSSGSVAGGARRDATLRITAAEQGLANLVELLATIGATRDNRVVSNPVQDCLTGKPGTQITRVLGTDGRSEEHTSELQSLMRNSYAVFCLKTKKQI